MLTLLTESKVIEMFYVQKIKVSDQFRPLIHSCPNILLYNIKYPHTHTDALHIHAYVYTS